MPSQTPITSIKKTPNISQFGELPDDAYISMSAIAAVCGVALSTVWRHAAADPNFPKPIKLSRRCTRLRVGDVRAYLKSKSGA